MEETPALVFKYKCRRNMFVARPAICRPVMQSPAPIVSFHHRSTKGRIEEEESHDPFVAALNPPRKVLRYKGATKAKTEPKSKQSARPTNKEVTLEFQRFFNSSLHLNVSPSSSIKFDRRDASSRLKLLAVVQRGESGQHSEKFASIASPSECSKQLPNFLEEKEEKSTSLKSPGKLTDIAMELPLCTKVSHFQGELSNAKRPGSVGDIEPVISEELRPIKGSICISGDELLKSQPIEVKRTNEHDSTFSSQGVKVRQLPLSYSLNEKTSKLASVTKAMQCSDQPDGEERGEENTAPPSRNTAPDSPYVSLHKYVRATYKPVCCCHTHSSCIRQRDVSTWTTGSKIRDRKGLSVSKVMQTDPPTHDKSTQCKLCTFRPSQKVQTALHSEDHIQRRSCAPRTSSQTAFDMWDTATISDNSQVSADPLSWYFDQLKLQRRCRSRHLRSKLGRYQNRPLQNVSWDCRGGHSSHDCQQRQRHRRRTCLPITSSVSTQTPRKLPSSSLPVHIHQKRRSESADLKRWIERPPLMRSATKSPHNRHCSNISPHARRRSPMVQRVVKPNDQTSLRSNYQMHTFSSILKRRNHPWPSSQLRNNTWR